MAPLNGVVFRGRFVNISFQRSNISFYEPIKRLSQSSLICTRSKSSISLSCRNLNRNHVLVHSRQRCCLAQAPLAFQHREFSNKSDTESKESSRTKSFQTRLSKLSETEKKGTNTKADYNGDNDKKADCCPDKIGSKSNFISDETRKQIRAISTQARSIPNIITITRICSTPIICNLIVTEKYNFAMAGCFLAGFSDWLDGYVAKNYKQQTVFGTYLDPLADKILINSIALSLSYVDVLPMWSSALWLGRDVVLVGMSYKLAAIAAKGRGHAVADPERTPLKVSPTTISKVNTVLQFGTLGAGLGLAAVGDTGLALNLGFTSLSVLDSLAIITGGTTVWSGLSYIDGKSMIKSGNSKSVQRKL